MISCLNFCSYVDSSFFCLNSLPKTKVYNIMYQTCLKNFEPQKKTELQHIHDIIQGESKVTDNLFVVFSLTCFHPLPVIRLINQGQNVNQKHLLGWTPLHTAAFNGSER